MTFDQGVTHGVQNRLDGELGITMGQLHKAVGQSFNKV